MMKIVIAVMKIIVIIAVLTEATMSISMYLLLKIFIIYHYFKLNNYFLLSLIITS